MDSAALVVHYHYFLITRQGAALPVIQAICLIRPLGPVLLTHRKYTIQIA